MGLLYKTQTKQIKVFTDSQAGGDGGELGELTGHRVHLDAQLSGGNQTQDPGHLGRPGLINQALQHRQHEGRRLP